MQHDVSAPLRDLAKTTPAVQSGPTDADDLKVIPLPSGFKPSSEPDTVLQKNATGAPTDPVTTGPTAGLNFEGLGTGFPNFPVHVAPPDTNGAVGLTQYVQWVNLSFVVFDKATGNVALGPVAGNTLWQGFGGGCEADNDGDPIVTYDKLADRWVFSQFVVRNQPFLQCVAVSTTPDATGTYNRYAFQYSNFNDYPKMGVWPDAYYVTFNIFDANFNFSGADACAYDRNAMLNGQAATQVCFQQASTVGSLLPADLDGHIPPPAGSPNFMMDFGANSLNLYKFHVDFVTPANSTFTGPVNIPVAPFTPFCPQVRGCVPQPPGDGTRLDSLGDRLMYRLAYRNFSDHESLVVNHSVVADPTNQNSGVRWYEIQNPNGAAPTVAQQSTFAPDGSYRWMGSVAMDVSGDLAVGYSVVNSTSVPPVFPSVAFAARAASDPASTLQAETSLVAGAGSQTFGLTRWGDYSAMQVDPQDDCTFWYTTEYLQNSGSFNWNTRIASFKFPGCGAPQLKVTSTHTGNFTQGQTGATYTLLVSNIGGKDTDGSQVTVTDTLPSGLTATAISGTNWTCTLNTLVCTRTDVLAKGSSYDAITLTVNVATNAVALVTNNVTTAGGGDKITESGSDSTTVIQNGADLAITKTHSGFFIQGQTGAYTLAVANVGLSATDGTTVTVTDTLPSGLTASSVVATGWTCSLGATVSCSRNDVLAHGTAYPSIMLTVNIASNAAAKLINTATVAGGGNVNPLNDSASDPTTVIPPPPDLTITKSHTGNFSQGQISAPYTLIVSNGGTGATSGSVIVRDALPAGLTFSSFAGTGPGWFCSGASSTVTCSRSDVLAVGSSYPPIRLSVNVAGNAPASVTNTATVSGGGDITPGNNTASDPTTINPAPDLTISKSHTPDPFIVGQTGTYTLTVNNIGSAATSGTVTVTDFLPNVLIATAITGSGWNCSTPPTQFISCTRSDALSGASSYPAITVTVSVNAGPSVTNIATVSGGGELNTLNNIARDLTNITAPVLAITESHTPEPFIAGQTGTYTINVNNTGKIATTGIVTVTDFLPSGLTATAVSGAGWTCSALPATFFMTCTRSDSLAAGGSYPPLLITVNVVNTGATVTNTVNVAGGGDSQGHSASDTANVNTPTLTITKSHTGNFTVGQIDNYRIVVGNVGKVATAGTVSVTDFLPFGMNAIAAGGTGWACSALPTNFLNCTRSDSLAINASYPPLTVVVSVTGGSGKVTNTATVTGGGDGVSHSASDPTIINGPVLGITKSHTGDPFIVGQTGTYTITVDNKAGTLATTGTVAVNDFLPSGLSATSVTGPGWTCSGVTAVNCSRSDSLAVGGTYPPITINVSVNGGAPSVSNVATVSGGGDPSSHSAFDFTNINGPLLAIVETHTDPFTVGQTGTYTITVNNKGGKIATTGTVTVQGFVPPGLLTVKTVTGTGWNCSISSPQITCTRSDSLAVGGTYPSISLAVNVNASSTFADTSVTVTGGGDPSIHQAFDFTNIIGPVLAITKSHTGDPFIVGQTGTYTITVDNKAGKTATMGTVTVQDFLPNGLTATAVTAPGWSCSSLPTSFLNCTRSDSLAVGGAYPSIVVTVNVAGGGQPSVTNTASVNGGGDPNFHSANDLTNISTPVLAITESHTPDPFIVGQTGIYTLTISNTGKVATSGTVTVLDPLPSGLTLSSFSGAGWGCTGSSFVNCTRSDALPPNSSYPAITLTVNVSSATPTITNTVSVTGGGDPNFHTATDTANATAPILAITKSHTGDFTVGQQGNYTITVSNAGSVATTGTVTVTDFLPSALSLASFSGTGWGCAGTSFVTCVRSDALAPNSSYPPLTLTVTVGGGQQSVFNSASVTGGGDGNNHSASDPTKINTPTLAITKTHSGTFAAGQSGGSYMITVSNPGTIGTTGTVSVFDTLPQGLTAITASAAGWNCSFLPSTFVNCSRSDSLAGGASYSPISLTTSVGGTAPGLVVNQASLSGGGDPFQHSANDPTAITLPDLAIALSHTGDFIFGQPATYTISVSNVGTIPTAGTGTLILDDLMPAGLTATTASGTGWACSILPGSQTELNCTRTADVLAPGSSYPPITLSVNVGIQAPSSITNSASVFGIGESNFANNTASDTASVTGLLFVPVTPCRVADTRGASGPFGGPSLIAETSRGFTIPSSACNIPANALAYSLNVTAVPHIELSVLTIYPCGEAVPNASTLNSFDGRVKAVAAIVPAGANGAVCAFPTQDADLVLDINGYFVPASNTSALAFYPLTPCRMVDTRNAAGPLGGPSLAGGSARDFPLLASSCNVPNTAQAYSLNVTTVSRAGIGFLTAWPAGQPQPSASTLNAPSSAAVANAAIVPAGTNGDISIFSTHATDVIVDVNGYFAPPGQGGLSLVPVPPCRVLDTRLPAGSTPFTGQLDVNVTASPCGLPATAQAYALNATVVPPGILGFLTLWPQGVVQPNASTLNSDGNITSNLGIIPTNNGSISAFASSPTFLILDVSGFFIAPPPVSPAVPAAVNHGIQANPGPAGTSASQPGVASPQNAPAPVPVVPNTLIRPSVEPPSTEGGDGSRSEGHGSVQPSNQSEQTEPAKNKLLEQAGWLLRFSHE